MPRALGARCSPARADAPCRNRAQLGFLDYVVKPLYAKLVEAVPTLQPCLARIDVNRVAWADIIAHGTAVAAAA